MPITVTIKERLVGKSVDNQEILQFWHESHNGLPVEIVNPQGEPLIENVRGNIAAFRRYMETWNFHFNDAGQNIRLESLTVDLDSRAYELYIGFNFFLNDVAIRMGLSSEIDKETGTGSEATQESFALIKNLLLKMVLKILSNKAGQDNMNIHYQKILGNFIDKLSHSKFATEKGMLPWSKGVNATDFAKYFMKDMALWKEKISWMVEEIGIINVTKNTVEANLQNLENIQRHVSRYLYIRLSNQFLDEGVELTDFSHDWIPNFLHRTEAAILNLDPVDPPLELAKTTGSSSLITRERGNAICTQLKLHKKINEKGMQESLEIIQELYRSLYDITVIKHAVQSIDTLVSMTGCLPFLMRYIRVEELSRYIDVYSKACMDACTDKGLENTIISVVCNAYGKPSLEKKILPFNKLGDSEILASMSSAIFAVLGELTRTCNTHGCASIINDSQKFILTSSPIEKKESSLLMLQGDVPKDALLNCLGLSRAALVELSEFLTQDNKVWKRVAIEAYEMLKDKSLPYQLQSFLKNNMDFDVDTYQAPFQLLPFLADELRTVLKLNHIPSNVLALSNNALLDFVEKQNHDWLDKYKTQIKEYKAALNASNDLLQLALMEKEFVLAWFKYWYLDTQGDLIYIPNVPTTLNILAELHNLSVIISKPDSLTKKVVQDTCNVFEKSERTIHINFTNNLPVAVSEEPALEIPDEAPVAEALPEDLPTVVKQNKTDLNNFLFEVFDSSLDAEHKKNIFDYFLTSNSIVGNRGVSGTLEAIDKANKVVSFFESASETLDAWFIRKGSDYVFSGILQLLEENPTLEREELCSLIESTLQQLIRKYMIVQISADYGNKPSSVSSRINFNNAPSLLNLGNDSTNSKKFLAFREDPLFHYARMDSGDYNCFVESPCPDSANSALLALDLDTRDHFMVTIKETIKKPVNRAMLAQDIFQELTNYCTLHPKEKIWETIALDNWVALLENHTRLEREVEALKYNLEKKNEYMERVKELAMCRSKMIDYCASTESGVCEKYIEKCMRDNSDIGKYMLRIYASEKQFSLYIYNRQNGVDSQFQEIVLDKEASLDYPHAQKSLHIVCNGKHYDKLTPQPSSFSAREIARSYFADLQKRLGVITGVCHLKDGQSLDDYRKALQQTSCNPGNGKALTIQEERMLERSKNFLIEAKPCMPLLKERQDFFVILESKGPLAPYIPRISQLQDQMVLADEPRDKKNRTLLYSALEKNVVALIEYFLDKKASVVSTNEGIFTVKSALPAGDCTYILEKKSNQRWYLSFYENSESDSLIIDIKEIWGLGGLLSSSNSSSTDQLKLYETAHELIRPYHEKRYVKTPLMLAASMVGFSKDNPLYFNLLTYAQKEAPVLLDDKLQQFPALQYCLVNIVPPVKELLTMYIDYQVRKLNSGFIVFGMGHPRFIISPLRGVNLHAKELASIYQAVVRVTDNCNFGELLDTLGELYELSQNMMESAFLYNGRSLSKIFLNAISWMRNNSAQYHKEYHEYQMMLGGKDAANVQSMKQFDELAAAKQKVKEAEQKIKDAEKKVKDIEENAGKIVSEAEKKVKDIEENAGKIVSEAEKKVKDTEASAKQKVSEAEEKVKDTEATAKKKISDAEKKVDDITQENTRLESLLLAMRKQMAEMQGKDPGLGSRSQPGNAPKSGGSEVPSGIPKGSEPGRLFSPRTTPELSGETGQKVLSNTPK